MASRVAIRFRRSLAERQALVGVAREIRATDPRSRRKYLRDFVDAFTTYEEAISAAELELAISAADVVLLGDYHALPSSQRFAAEMVEQIAALGRPVVLAFEMIFTRDQPILDAWTRGEIGDADLRARIRFDAEWGYEWPPFLELLQRARQAGAALHGVDCRPRGDLRRIAARDRHAAAQLAQLRQEYPKALLVGLFGESHLAPQHLPAEVRRRLPEARVVTVLQNVDALYWRAAGERSDRVEAVRVGPDVFCAFNATPLEKYESYRLCLERWRQERPTPDDFTPTFYNLIDALLRFLNINQYAAAPGAGPRFLVDLLPEVDVRADPATLAHALQRAGASEAEIQQGVARLDAADVCYLPHLNTLALRRFQMLHAAEEAAHFVHHACRGEWQEAPADDQPEDRFYVRVLEEALAYCGARALYPKGPAARESDLYALYTQPRAAIEEQTIQSYRDYLQMVDFLVLHKDYEANVRAYSDVPELMRAGVQANGERFAFCTRMLGRLLGAELYGQYVAGRISRRFLRGLFRRKLLAAGAARLAYFTAVRRLREPRRRRPAA